MLHFVRSTDDLINRIGDMLDDLDRRLLALLRADSRDPVASLAAKLKVSRGTVQNRIAKMVGTSGAIQAFTVRTRPEMEASRVRAIMTIAIEGERSGAVVKALRGFPEVDKVHTTNGRWDLIAELDTETLAAFSQTLDQIRLIDGIASTETSILLATQKM
jgi:DNA-binding Lrp family transcriptional regulator